MASFRGNPAVKFKQKAVGCGDICVSGFFSSKPAIEELILTSFSEFTSFVDFPRILAVLIARFKHHIYPLRKENE